MTPDPLQPACAKVQRELDYGYDVASSIEETKNIDENNLAILLAFAKAQRAAGVREVIQLSRTHHCECLHCCNCQYEIEALCEQRAKELEGA